MFDHGGDGLIKCSHRRQSFRDLPKKHCIKQYTINNTALSGVKSNLGRKLDQRLQFASPFLLLFIFCFSINYFSFTKCFPPHPTCDVVAASHLGLIQVETPWTMLRRHHDVSTGTLMRQTYLRRLCDVSLVLK